MTVLDWYADAHDPIAYQNDVLAWLERNGVKDPAVQGIERVSIEQHPAGWTIVLDKIVLDSRGNVVGVPAGFGEFEPARETVRLKMLSLQPARP